MNEFIHQTFDAIGTIIAWEASKMLYREIQEWLGYAVTIKGKDGKKIRLSGYDKAAVKQVADTFRE